MSVGARFSVDAKIESGEAYANDLSAAIEQANLFAPSDEWRVAVDIQPGRAPETVIVWLGRVAASEPPIPWEEVIWPAKHLMELRQQMIAQWRADVTDRQRSRA